MIGAKLARHADAGIVKEWLRRGQVVGRLSTHVLDTVRGKPATGVVVALHRLADGAWQPIIERTTNADGRTDPPLSAYEALGGANLERALNGHKSRRY
jgi:5-hydroxyisourate hydrolase-like protein (transthyretin family)